MTSDTILDIYNKHKDLCNKYNISFSLFEDISKSYIKLNNEFIEEARENELDKFDILFHNTYPNRLITHYANFKVQNIFDDAFDRIVRECNIVENPVDIKYTYKNIRRRMRDWRLNDIYCELQYLFYDFIPWII